MSLASLSSYLQKDPSTSLALDAARGGGDIAAPPGALTPLVAAIQADSAVTVVVCATGRESDQMRDELRSLVPSTTTVLDFPAWETMPHERLSPHPETVARRRSALRQIANPAGRAPLVVVASIRALVQPVNPEVADYEPAEARSKDSSRTLQGWVDYLVQAAYQRVDLVTRRGEFAVRGGIVDVFPPLAEHPVRLDFFGSEIEQITFFSVADQRSLGEPLTSVSLEPVREILLTRDVRSRAAELASEYPGLETMLAKVAEGIAVEGMESLQPLLVPKLVSPLELLPLQATIVEVSSQRVRSRAEILLETNREFLAAAWDAAGFGDSEAPLDIRHGSFMTYDELRQSAGSHPWISLDSLDTGDAGVQRPEISALPLTSVGGEEVWDFLAARSQAQDRILVVAAGHGLVERSAHVLGERDIAHRIDETLASDLTPGVVTVVQGVLREGFMLKSSGLVCITEKELYGKAVSASPRTGRTLATKRTRVVDPLQLSAGDYVVHDTHGVGRFVELVSREISTGGRHAMKSQREFVVLEYAPSKRGGPPDKLFVPTDQLDQLSHYVGSDSPALSKMGGSDWASTKGKARKAVRELAVDLVKLYSARMAAPGFAFSPDTPWQRELEEAFPFVETPDQLTTIDEVKADMERPIPMDRLIAGDVGFGKTEIAVRAAFKAIQDHKQVALIAPTTLLVKQHMETFQERYAPFPIVVKALSRFQTDAEAKAVVAGLADGSVDIVIGTHRLLGKGVKFKDLGLVIVDEEQRFGVEHKDSLKALKTNVDVLAMSATPIPRTLEMAVTGIREMSTLATPPEARHPILTFVGPFNEPQVVAAIRRELLREGQVFFVHNRVSTINSVASRVAELVPEARVAVAHGQMGEADLERVMVDFWERRFDVLVSTTIIETGLDVTNANTLIVDRAERYGLSQLHQLRGRVGRGRERGYAYLLYDPELPIGELAHDRLATLASTTDLGGGTRIAMKDLEMRGAGNLLGAEQAGHIQGVGFDLYLRMVGEAIALFRDDVAPGQTELRLELPLDARIPNDYIDSERLRLEMYQKLSGAAAPLAADGAVDELVEEMKDRYGELPLPVQALVMVTKLRRLAMLRGISEAIVMGNKLRVVGPPIKDSLQVRMARLYPKATYMAPARALLIPLPEDYSDHALITWVEGVIEALYPEPSSASPSDQPDPAD